MKIFSCNPSKKEYNQLYDPIRVTFKTLPTYKMKNTIENILSKITIKTKYETEKRDQKRFAYIININWFDFDYYGSNKEYTDQKILDKATSYRMIPNKKVISEDKIKKDSLCCLISDLSCIDWYDMAEFLVEFWYSETEEKIREGEICFHQIHQNETKLRKAFTNDEIDFLKDYFQDY